MTNIEFTNDKLFIIACELGKVEPTVRQASKWKNHKGTAYKLRYEAMKEMEKRAKDY